MESRFCLFSSPRIRPWTGMEADGFYHCVNRALSFNQFSRESKRFSAKTVRLFPRNINKVPKTQRNLIKLSSAPGIWWLGKVTGSAILGQGCVVVRLIDKTPLLRNSLVVPRRAPPQAILHAFFAPKLGENTIKRKIRSQYNRALRQNLLCATSKLNFPSSVHTGTLCRLWCFSGARIHLHSGLNEYLLLFYCICWTSTAAFRCERKQET